MAERERRHADDEQVVELEEQVAEEAEHQRGHEQSRALCSITQATSSGASRHLVMLSHGSASAPLSTRWTTVITPKARIHGLFMAVMGSRYRRADPCGR